MWVSLFYFLITPTRVHTHTYSWARLVKLHGKWNTEEFTGRFSNLILQDKHFGVDKPKGSVLMEVCMRYVSVTRYKQNVQVKRWLQEGGMSLGDYLLMHFSSLWNYGHEKLANADVLGFLLETYYCLLKVISGGLVPLRQDLGGLVHEDD